MSPASSEPFLLALGFIGQACFFGRFFLQWVHAERLGRSEIPVGFWYLSIAGGLLVLVYAILRRDPVFIVGQSTGVLIYARNLQLIRRARPRPEPPSRTAAPGSR